MTAKAEYIPNCYVCNKCGSRMDAIITPPLSTLGKIKLVCNNCNKYMSKEKTLEEYRKKFGLCGIKSDKCDCYKELKFIEKLLSKQKKEVLSECLEVVIDARDMGYGIPYIEHEINNKIFKNYYEK